MNKHFQSTRILFLEDEPLIAMDTSECLAELGFENVHTVYRLRDAEITARDKEFDVAILDINVDGGRKSYDLGRDLKARGVKVIFASGTESSRDQLLDEGYQFLAKPYQAYGLRELIAEAIGAAS